MPLLTQPLSDIFPTDPGTAPSNRLSFHRFPGKMKKDETWFPKAFMALYHGDILRSGRCHCLGLGIFSTNYLGGECSVEMPHSSTFQIRSRVSSRYGGSEGCQAHQSYGQCCPLTPFLPAVNQTSVYLRLSTGSTAS